MHKAPTPLSTSETTTHWPGVAPLEIWASGRLKRSLEIAVPESGVAGLFYAREKQGAFR